MTFRRSAQDAGCQRGDGAADLSRVPLTRGGGALAPLPREVTPGRPARSPRRREGGFHGDPVAAPGPPGLGSSPCRVRLRRASRATEALPLPYKVDQPEDVMARS